MYWAMNSFFQNEFKNNPATIGYDNLAEAFGYDNSIPTCFFMVIVISVVIRLATLVAMSHITFSKS
jgi:hypothetical protein